jgi:hypothetical protein
MARRKIMQKFSPNWYWDQLGYTIERPTKYWRTIYDTQGQIVCNRAGADAEQSISRWLYESLTENPEIDCPLS